MAYTTRDIAAALRQAREARALSQGALGASVGLPQSHVSRIESGAVDLKLSSLIELARALDLDLMLVPRQLAPAVESIIRSAEGTDPQDRRAAREVRLLQKAVATLRGRHPDDDRLRRLHDTARGLTNIRLDDAALELVHETRLMLKDAAAGEAALDDVLRAGDALRQARNRLAHGGAEPPRRPAYALDDEGGRHG